MRGARGPRPSSRSARDPPAAGRRAPRRGPRRRPGSARRAAAPCRSSPTARPARGRRAEDREHELADRVGRERAVAAQLLPGPVAAHALVDAVGLDQAHERLARRARTRAASAADARAAGGWRGPRRPRRAPLRASPAPPAGRPRASRRARRRAGRSRRSRAGDRAGAAAAGGWRRGSSRVAARAITASAAGARRRRRCSAMSVTPAARRRRPRMRRLTGGIAAEAAPERHHREREPVEVVVDVVVRREAGAGVLRLVPAAVRRAGCHQPAHAARDAPRQRSPAACSASSAQAVCEAVLGPRPIHARVVVGARVLAPAAVLVLVALQPAHRAPDARRSAGSTPAATSPGRRRRCRRRG